MTTIDIDAYDWMRTQEKRAIHLVRRPHVRHASDLLGPGIGAATTVITDWNSDEAAFNGFFSSEPGAAHVPYAGYWAGQTISNLDGVGFQEATEYLDGAGGLPAKYVRTFALNTGGVRVYTAWTATQADTGRVTTGFTASTGFTLTSCSYRILGGLDVDVRMEYACNINVVATNGNIGDTPMGTVPAAARPLVTTHYGIWQASGRTDGSYVIGTDGIAILQTASQDLATTDNIHLRARYLRN